MEACWHPNASKVVGSKAIPLLSVDTPFYPHACTTGHSSSKREADQNNDLESAQVGKCVYVLAPPDGPFGRHASWERLSFAVSQNASGAPEDNWIDGFLFLS